jgi:FKBP-type peptidyl-prolyl cis-trans isomerase (trigger factor)
MELTKAELEQLKSEVKKEILKELEEKVRKEVEKQLKSKGTQTEMQEVTAKVLEQLFRTLWNRSSMWKMSVIKK